jgi:hypothetical protein
MTHYTPDYTHAIWYTEFLLTSFANFTIVWATLVLDSLKRGSEPTKLAIVMAAPGIAFAIFPPMWAMGAAMNLVFFFEQGVPWGPAVCTVLLYITGMFAFWNHVIPFDLITRRART